MSRIAVTGATGFVGRHLVPVLQAEGHEVRCLTRSATSSLPLSAETVVGDVRSADRVRSLLEGCDVVVHLAASFSPGQDVADIIVSGTNAVVTAAREAGVSRIVYLSCLGAEAADRSSFYRAKWTGEMIVRAGEIPYTTLRPSLVLGPGDGVLRPLSAMVRSWPAIPIPGRGEERHQPIAVDDLVRCIIKSTEGDTVANESVSVGGETFLTYRQLVDLVCGRLGVTRPKLLLPASVLARVAGMLPEAARTLYDGPRLAMLQQDVVASPGIVLRVFGFEPQPLAAMLATYLA